jgi:hypothetical protein
LEQNNYDLRGVDTAGSARTLVRINSSNEAEYGWSGAGPVKFMGGGSYTERMRIHTNGNVGIGTTAPQAPLHVIAASNSNNALIQEWSYTSTQLDIYSLMLKQTVTSGVVRYNFSMVNNGTAYNDVLVLDRGNVGIGTTSPDAKLQVAGGGLIVGTTNHTKSSNAFSNGNISLDNGSTTDSPGIHFYYGNNTNFGIDVHTTGFRFVQNLDEAGGNVLLNITSTGNVGIGTTSPSAKLHVIGNVTVSATLLTANVKLTGTLTDSLNQVGTSGQVLSSTGTGTEWITGGGGGGGSTIAVEDEGVSIGSSFGTLDFQGNNIQATASGSTAIITAFNNAGTGSGFANDLATPYVIPATWMEDVDINGNIVFGSAPDKSDFDSKLIAMVTFGVSNVSSYDDFNGFFFRLYNFTQGFEITNTEHRWSSYMSKTDTTTVFTFHIPIESTEVAGGDEIRIQAQQTTLFTPEIYYCALTLIEGTN